MKPAYLSITVFWRPKIGLNGSYIIDVTKSKIARATPNPMTNDQESTIQNTNCQLDKMKLMTLNLVDFIRFTITWNLVNFIWWKLVNLVLELNQLGVVWRCRDSHSDRIDRIDLSDRIDRKLMGTRSRTNLMKWNLVNLIWRNLIDFTVYARSNSLWLTKESLNLSILDIWRIVLTNFSMLIPNHPTWLM